jgi:hypothetical protein
LKTTGTSLVERHIGLGTPDIAREDICGLPLVVDLFFKGDGYLWLIGHADLFDISACRKALQSYMLRRY